jgi:hypothetical protein
LQHREEAERFYRDVAAQGMKVRVEASGRARWFERLLAELTFELWIGDAAEIRANRDYSSTRCKRLQTKFMPWLGRGLLPPPLQSDGMVLLLPLFRVRLDKRKDLLQFWSTPTSCAADM